MADNRKKDWKKELSTKEKVAVIRAEREKEEAKKTQYEKNAQKYEIWASKDERGKMMIDRYNLHGQTKNVISISQENFGMSTPPRSNSVDNLKAMNQSNVSSSNLLRGSGNNNNNNNNNSKHSRRVSMSHAEEIFQKEKLKMNDVRSKFVPKPSVFSPQTIQLLYQNHVLYWPINLVTLQNLQDRFNINNPYLILSTAPSGPAAIRFYAEADGSYPINGNGSYTIIPTPIKQLKKEDSAPQLKKTKSGGRDKSDIISFLTDGVFQKKDSLSTLGGMRSKSETKVIRSECFVFSTEKKFVFKEYKGEEGIKLRETLSYSGKWKLKGKGGEYRLTLKPSKDKSGISRAVDNVQEKQNLYSSFVVEEKYLECEAQPAYKFHPSRGVS